MSAIKGYIGYQLRALMTDNVLSSLFTDPENPDDFIAGYIRACNSRQCMVESVNPYGRFDGWFVVRNSCCNEAVYDVLYAQRLEMLIQLNGSRPSVMPMPGPEEDFLRYTLLYAQEHHRVVTIWTREEAFTGFVQDVDDLRVSLGVLDFMGQNPLPTLFPLHDIELMAYGSEEERMYEQLDSFFSHGGILGER